MQIKIEKRDSGERLTVEVTNSNVAKALANWLGTTNFRVSAEVVFGEEPPAPEPVADGPVAAAAPKRATKPAPAGEDIKAVRDHLAKHAGANAKAVAQGTGLGVDKVRACLAWLRDAGQVTSQGKGPGTTYAIAEGM